MQYPLIWGFVILVIVIVVIAMIIYLVTLMRDSAEAKWEDRHESSGISDKQDLPKDAVKVVKVVSAVKHGSDYRVGRD